jgi:hypothetical protein
MLQLLAMVVAPHGIANPGVQHFLSGTLDQDLLLCDPTCRSARSIARAALSTSTPPTRKYVRYVALPGRRLADGRAFEASSDARHSE